ncbi:aspartyl protease family protein [Sphingomonas sp. 2R-10]|uniref:aspartyl protease family protein n=1 Tax=Sphingomonas sp. 2R-10 TaxID=3045148 RepID=UPI003FA7D86A
MRLIALLALVCGAPAIAQPDAPLVTPATGEGWIPFDDSTDAIIVRIMVDGRPLDAVVDTGAPTTVIDRAWASRNGLTVEPFEAAATRGAAAQRRTGSRDFAVSRWVGSNRRPPGWPRARTRPISSPGSISAGRAPTSRRS